MTTKTLWEHALAGIGWLAEKQQPDGAWSGLSDPKLDAFYKVSWACTATGNPSLAHRSLTYAKQNYMQADGDFSSRGHPWHTSVHYLYANAYFIVGSMLSGRYEIAMPALRFLISQQDSESSGFYSLRTESGTQNICDTMSVGAAGVACLAAGQLEAAARAAEFLQAHVERQPAPQERFHTVLGVDGTPDTEPKNDDEAWWKIIDTRKENQCWYAVGLPFAFLVRLWQATQQTRHRELAQWFFDFQQRCVDPWEGGSSGKAGWGCAMLYRITGERRYRDIAVHIASRYVNTQLGDGHWPGGVGDRSADAPLINADFDATAELSLWLALIATNIAARASEGSLSVQGR